MKGFVERIGDSVALVSADGSAHDPDLLMVEALDAMVLAAGADVASSEITIAVPAYWKPSTVQALRNGLRTHVGFVRSGMAPRLVSDAIASLTAVNSELVPAGQRCGRAARFRRRRHVCHVGECRGRFRARQRHNALRGFLRQRDRPGVAAYGFSRSWAAAAASTRPVPPPSGSSVNSGNSAVRPRSGYRPTRSPKSPPSSGAAAAAWR